jgi:pyruvate formate lyase activating enzyme
VNVKGLLKTSLIDYPGEISSVVFIGGCNLRCRFCHNANLVNDYNETPSIPLEEVFSTLISRKKNISSIVITGGEPSFNSSIIEFISELKAHNFKVKLDTNGFFPEVIQSLSSKKMIDYISLDIKTSPAKYKDLTGDSSFDKVLSTLNILKDNDIDYEVRTTCVPGFVDIDELLEIGNCTGQVKKYYLQQFRNEITLDNAFSAFRPYSKEKLLELKDYVATFSNYCEIRGI